MKKQKRVLKTIIILLILLVLLTPMMSFATNESETITTKFYTKSNQTIYNFGDNIDISITWKNYIGDSEDSSANNVQAIGFTLKYDASKLEFIDVTFNEVAEDNTTQTIPLEENFYNIETPGTIILSKISLNNTNISQINFNFKTIALGASVIQLSEVDCIADGNLVSPNVIDITNGLITIKAIAFGDVDLSGTTNTDDITLLQQYLEGTQELTEQQLENADVNLDGEVDIIDVKFIQESLDSSITLPIRYGDANLDGKVDIQDVLLILKGASGIVELSGQAFYQSDVTMDGLITTADNLLVLNYVAGITDSGLPFRMIKNLNLKTAAKGNLYIVSGFDLEKATVSKLLENFNISKGVEICNSNNAVLEDDALFGTGTKVQLMGSSQRSDDENIGLDDIENLAQTEDIEGFEDDENNENGNWAMVYTVVIYGDTTGDGKINAIDALALIKHLNDAIPFTSEAFVEAGRIVCEEGEDPTAVDALAIIKHANKKQLISQIK